MRQKECNYSILRAHRSNRKQRTRLVDTKDTQFPHQREEVIQVPFKNKKEYQRFCYFLSAKNGQTQQRAYLMFLDRTWALAKDSKAFPVAPKDYSQKGRSHFEIWSNLIQKRKYILRSQNLLILCTTESFFIPKKGKEQS